MISKNQAKLIRQLEQKKFRRREGLFVAEGPKVVGDLLSAGFLPHTIFATTEWMNENPDAGTGKRGALSRDNVTLPVTEVSDEELRKVSFLQHPQQVLALFRLPERAAGFCPTEAPLPSPDALCLALDGVQDPGNLGTIIRIADWFGIDTIYCSEDTSDAWNPKVVQATMGSIARVNIFYTSLHDLISQAAVPVYGTLLDGDNIYTQPLSKGGIIVMGNEGNGISPEIRPLVTHRLLIPAFRQGDTAESLNVAIATAITCSEFRRRTNKFHTVLDPKG